MDATFMAQVRDRVAQATQAVASFYDPSSSEDVPELPTLQELLVELASEATHRCGQCKAMLSEGARSRICLACGEFQPAAAKTPDESFDFNTSLALQLFFDSLKLDGSGLGVKKAAQPKYHQDFMQESSAYGQAQKSAPENLTGSAKSTYFAEVDEEDIWESADGEGGAVNWTQHLAEASAGDFFSGLPNDNKSFYGANQTFVETTTDDFDDFFQAAPQPQPQSQTQNQQHNLDFFQNVTQSKGDVNFPIVDDSLFALGIQNRPAAQNPTSASSIQDSSVKKSTEFPTRVSVLDHQGSSNDFFGQLEGLNLSRSQSLQERDNEPVAAVKSILSELPDLSFMLADRLVVPGGKKTVSMWSFKELE
ncbi:hypothetical protein MPTK1_5g02390 [Marchantia polymorpha subsp. ruderalis]|uniref:Uncharacterized protein n=2 Tax=Marchantia polymorpha TaxID=3197 RepID=A0AAF6BE60_MARPO|nr:hypothetical protein MARPO_0147s0032 [Marchantia polymorpha]BBN10292.1 hypothetical protein Mp_5g02390 [Marchantia polymorpha subsp. ruderalis]PTQ29154.1 hypothetical protein MARPO_0147s0032 [Marchantia polymorpha]PTQ29155.1 hypothetical protein MARPO_0147s0032 [Marchantia polymorpha]BBN10293.1 hypothetical protein Mp_5g02390 [Marchantia polymorpha subsp. ruderalis]|eukprot:PTQ29153.1 hypothetical protein MARPO_0147s0032 [Marchantia polymorpha]